MTARSLCVSNLEQQKLIREACIRLLTRREHSQKELLNKLAVHGFEQVDIQRGIDRLDEEGWQSDERFAESYTRHRIKKGFGPLKINYELRQRGIEGFDFEPIVLELADSWFQLLVLLYEKKYLEKGCLSQKEKQKRSRFLQQRGFSHEMIHSLFKRGT